jgi:hypothetical protein
LYYDQHYSIPKEDEDIRIEVNYRSIASILAKQEKHYDKR